MHVWTYDIEKEVFGNWQTETDQIQYLDNTPVSGTIALSSRPIMYESVTTWVFFNISIFLDSRTPLNMSIYRIEFMFTFSDSEDSTRVGSISLSLNLVNISSLAFWGHAEISPVILSSEKTVYLGAGFQYNVENYSSMATNEWFGGGGSLYMIPVDIYSSVFRNGFWLYSFAAVLILWIPVCAFKYRETT
jgi:hypothetical protein